MNNANESSNASIEDVLLSDEESINEKITHGASTKNEDSSALLASLEALDTNDNVDDEWENTPLESDDDLEQEPRERATSSTIEQVLPMDKIKSGAANALNLLSWGVDVVKHSASETAENIKKNENFQGVVSNIQPGINKIKEDASVATESLRTKSAEIYESAKPGLEEFTENASKSISSWTQSLSCFASNATSTIEKAIDDSAESLFGASTTSDTPSSHVPQPETAFASVSTQSAGSKQQETSNEK